jgi:hypothetical protein
MSPIAAEERTADTRVVATGVTVRPAFLQLKPELSARESTPADEAALHAECGRLDLQDNRFVHAPNFELASAAQKAYRELIAGIRSDAPPFEVRCGGPAGASSCKETVEQDRTIEFMVGSCGQYDPHPTCISIRTFDHDIEVTLSKGVIQKVIFENRVFVISGN